jgi:hypothetical protein
MEAEDKSLVDQAIDLLFYAPVGIAITATEELPELIAKGRSRVATELGNARALGALALAHGQRRAGTLVEQAVRAVVLGGGEGPASNGAAPGTAPDTPEGTSAPEHRPSAQGGGPRPLTSEGAAALAIPGYDSLSALHVVQRLDGLSADELAAVGCYEESHRGRQTILNRISQLKSQGD